MGHRSWLGVDGLRGRFGAMGSVLAVVALLIGLSVAPFPAVAQESVDDLNNSPVIVWVAGFSLLGAPFDQAAGGQTWDDGDVVDLYVNDVYVGTSIAEPNAEGSASPFFTPDPFPVAGDEVKLVRADPPGREEAHIVTALTPVSVSATEDTVTGMAAPSSEVFVGSGLTSRTETASPSGEWVADFSVPGDQPGEETTLDIGPDTIGVAAQFDADGNGTGFLWAPTTAPPEPGSKADCKHGGWQGLADDTGTPFKNQGDCVSYVTTGGSDPSNG